MLSKSLISVAALPLLAAHLGSAEIYQKSLLAAGVLAAIFVVVYSLRVVTRRSKVEGRPKWNWWELLIYVGMIVSVAVLSITSFGSVLRFGVLDGWPLFLHMLGAGLFTAMLPLLAITWCEAHACRAVASDGESESRPQHFFWLPKAAFWVMLVSGLVVTLTMLLSMLPIFGTDGLHTLLDVHRYSGLVLVLALVLHVFGTIVQRLGLR